MTDKYDGMDAWEIRAEAERIIGMDYVPTDALIDLLRQFAPEEEER